VFEREAEFHSQASPRAARPLTEADAIDIWIARWLRIPRKALVARYGCDPRRIYEVWWGEKFPRSRELAVAMFRQRYPDLVERTDFGYRRVSRRPRHPPDADQVAFKFD
jgi:hypothetical protein